MGRVWFTDIHVPHSCSLQPPLKCDLPPKLGFSICQNSLPVCQRAVVLHSSTLVISAPWFPCPSRPLQALGLTCFSLITSHNLCVDNTAVCVFSSSRLIICMLSSRGRRQGRTLDVNDVTCFCCCDKHFKCELSDWTKTKAFAHAFFCLREPVQSLASTLLNSIMGDLWRGQP